MRLPRAHDAAAVGGVADNLRADRDITSVSPAQISPAGTTAVLDAYPRSSPQSAATTELVNHVRDTLLQRVQQATGATILIGGASASAIDFSQVLSSKLPLFVAVVLILSAILLALVFRSLVIPVQAAVMNILSIGASLGVIVAIFQWGWLGSLLGVTPGPIEGCIPRSCSQSSSDSRWNTKCSSSPASTRWSRTASTAWLDATSALAVMNGQPR